MADQGRTRPLRVAVFGARGRLGTALCAGIIEAGDLELAAELGRDDDRSALAGLDLALEVSQPEAAEANTLAALDAGLDVVVGTSGLGPEALDRLRDRLADRPGRAVRVVPNFGLGAVLLMRFAEQAARYFPSVEIVELHHPGKADAPSGTARRTAELVAAARDAAGVPAPPDATRHALDGARGAEVAGIRVHAVRMAGLVASQEVLLGGPGETLSLRHDAPDRTSFVPGALLALRRVAETPGLTVGLDDLL